MKVIGTDELIGAVITSVDYDTVRAEKDGRKFRLEKTEEWWDTCFCGGHCSCSPTIYLRAYEE